MSAEKKDFLIYDSGCNFCTRSISIMKKITANAIDFKPSVEIEDGFYGITKDSFNSSIKFFEYKDKVEAINDYEKVIHYEQHDEHEDAILYHGAYAVLKALSSNSIFKPFLFIYRYVPFVSVLVEAAYRIIARNRAQISETFGIEACKIN